MYTQQLSRVALDPSLHAVIDAQLKSLKQCARKLQSALAIQATELHVLHRLYYKNKNQHRGALFWRNVVEIRRLLEKIEKLDLVGSVNGLRLMFYDTDEIQNINSTKGPWTHVPNANYLRSYAKQCSEALKLTEKTIAQSIRAYESFHLALQSAAFLHLLLMFVAVASRTRIFSLEIYDALQQANASVTILISAVTENPRGNPNYRVVQEEKRADTHSPMIFHESSIALPSTTILSTPDFPEQSITHNSVATSIVVGTSNSDKKRKKPMKSEQESIAENKKKKKRKKDEIDDIFGF